MLLIPYLENEKGSAPLDILNLLFLSFSFNFSLISSNSALFLFLLEISILFSFVSISFTSFKISDLLRVLIKNDELLID